MSETGMRKLASSNHGGRVRGDTMRRRSSMFEGRFGRMFRNLPPASWPEDALHALGAAMLAPPEATDATPRLPKAAPETDAILQDDEENSGIAAGYTYLGQFIDHDITFDPASSLQQQNDPDGLVDFRTPRLDLDSVYGRGPDDQPYMYDGKRFRLGRPLLELDQPSPRRDLPRARVLGSHPRLAAAHRGPASGQAGRSRAQPGQPGGPQPAARHGHGTAERAGGRRRDGRPARARRAAFRGQGHHGRAGERPQARRHRPELANNAPLWYYVLAEAQHEWLLRAAGPGGKGNAEPVRLGAVGKRIVTETLIGLLAADGRSYLRQNPNWQPVVAGQPIRTMGSLLQFALA